MKISRMLLSFVLMWQFACASKVELSQESVPVDLQKEEIEAQKLIEAGIKFDFTINADGVTGEGGIYTGHGYKSPDGFEIGTQVGVYKKQENAVRCFEDASKQISAVLLRESVSGKNGKIVERVVAISRKTNTYFGKYLIVKKVENNCSVYFSSSLKHLLAFEKWRDRD